VIRAWTYAEGDRTRADVAATDLRQAVEVPGALVWVDGQELDDDERELLREQLQVPTSVVEAFTNPYERTKLLRYGDCFHVAVHDCQLNGNELESREIDVVIGPGWLLTVRHPSPGHDLDLDGIAHRFELHLDEQGAIQEGLLLWALCDMVIDRYFDVNDTVDACLDHVEDLVFADTTGGIPRETFTLRRSLQEFRRDAAPMREVLNAINRGEVPYVQPEAVVHFRDLYDRMLRVVDVIESQRDLLTGLVEAELSIISNRSNEVMKRLTSWGAILIVATLIAGIYGMNFHHMPELRWELGYPFAIGSMLVVGFVMWWYFKRKRWL
jgi:magnesium transporter